MLCWEVEKGVEAKRNTNKWIRYINVSQFLLDIIDILKLEYM